MKNIQKKKKNLVLFGGEIQNLGGEISPPKGPEKTLQTQHSLTVTTTCGVYCRNYPILSYVLFQPL